MAQIREIHLVNTPRCPDRYRRRDWPDIGQFPGKPALRVTAGAGGRDVGLNEGANRPDPNDRDGMTIVFIAIDMKEALVFNDQQVLGWVKMRVPAADFEGFLAGRNAPAVGAHDGQGLEGLLAVQVWAQVPTSLVFKQTNRNLYSGLSEHGNACSGITGVGIEHRDMHSRDTRGNQRQGA